ncbi:MAG TPA: ectonucleotide pyrophosphatase/phosphodiesterase [Chitinophagaceae bacterium]
MERRGICLLFICCFVQGLFAQDTTELVMAARVNAGSQLSKPYVILVSADAFRYDYAQKYHAANLLSLSARGVKAESMMPSYPSVTFPNHYTIATGLYPSHHGIVYNRFYDRSRMESYGLSNREVVEDGSWYGGIPLWVLAEQKGMLAAAYHFPGTEAPVRGIYSSYRYRYNSKTPLAVGVRAVDRWLRLPDSIRPHFISFYIGDVDEAGHHTGPDSRQTREAVLRVDQIIGELNEVVRSSGLPVNFIFVSDHGMARVDTTSAINIRSMIDTAKFIIAEGSTAMHLYARKPSDIMDTYRKLKRAENGFSVYLRDSIPAEWNYNSTADRFNRIGDIYIAAVYPKVFSSWNGRINPGTHGYDPVMREMHAIFYAWGPAFRAGANIGIIRNVDVYPLVCRILGLEFDEGIDGDGKVWEAVLR